MASSRTQPAVSGGGAGAPTGAQYVTLATDGTLSAERVLTAGDGITLTDAGAGGAVTAAAAVHVVPGRRTEYWWATGTKINSGTQTNCTVSGTVAANASADGYATSMTTKASGNFDSKIAHSNDKWCRTDNDPSFSIRFKTGADVDAFRFLMCVTENPGGDHDADEPSLKYAGVRFNPTDGDTKFEIHASDGSTAATPVEVNVTPAADAVYQIKVDVDQAAGTITADINGTTATLSAGANMPPADEYIAMLIIMYAEGGGSEDRRVWNFYSNKLTAE